MYVNCPPNPVLSFWDSVNNSPFKATMQIAQERFRCNSNAGTSRDCSSFPFCQPRALPPHLFSLMFTQLCIV